MLFLSIGLGVVAYILMNCLFAYLARYHAASALILAAKWNSTATTKGLLDAGADVSWKSDFWAKKVRQQIRSKKDIIEHPISYAAMLGHAEIVELLLKAGADIEYKDREGRSPLSLAVEANHTAVARVLIDYGADLYSTDMWGQSSLGYAAINNDDEIMDLLVKVLQEHERTSKDSVNLRDADETADSEDDSSKSINDESDSEGGDSDQVVEEGLDDLFVYVSASGHLGRAQSLFAMGDGACYPESSRKHCFLLNSEGVSHNSGELGQCMVFLARHGQNSGTCFVKTGLLKRITVHHYLAVTGRMGIGRKRFPL